MSLPQEIQQIITEHAAIRFRPLSGTDGFSLPSYADLIVVEASQETKPELLALGIEVLDNPGKGNRFYLDRGMPKIDLKVKLNNRQGTNIFIEAGSRLGGIMHFEGDGHLFVVGRSERENRFSSTFRNHRCALIIGRECSSPGVACWLEGPERSIQIGDDCMFSWGIWLRTSDSHGIVDLKTRDTINYPGNIILGPHVWLGQDALILKDIEIGAGSIIGAKSVVNKSVPSCCIAAGVPARVVRTDSSWTRAPQPDEAAVNDLFDMSFLQHQ